MKPAELRPAVRYLEAEWCMSERHACGLVELERSTARYVNCREDDAVVRARLRALAGEKRRYGYRRLGVLLRREGMLVNHKREERIYREEGLSVRRRKRKRACSVARTPTPRPEHADELWSLDFVHDQLWWGRRLRTLNVLDVYTREALAIEVDSSLGNQTPEEFRRAITRPLPTGRDPVELS